MGNNLQECILFSRKWICFWRFCFASALKNVETIYFLLSKILLIGFLFYSAYFSEKTPLIIILITFQYK